jgi:hypothetical protein
MEPRTWLGLGLLFPPEHGVPSANMMAHPFQFSHGVEKVIAFVFEVQTIELSHGQGLEGRGHMSLILAV